VEALSIDDEGEMAALRVVVEWHARKTRSKYAEQILANWAQMQDRFVRVLPRGTSTSARDFVDASEYDGNLLRASH